MQGKAQEKTDPLVNVIIPVYKVEDYLGKCLDSLLCQTWQNLDVILIDDGSPDTCGAICDHYAEKDLRIRVFHTENHGLSAARNLGIQKAWETDSDFLVFVDSDDWLENDMIEKLVITALTTGTDIVMCGEYYEYPKTKKSIKPDQAISTGIESARAIMSGELSTQVMIRIWRKKLFDKIRFPEGRVYEDAATTYKLYLEADKTAVIPDTLYHYRLRTGSIIHTHNIRHTLDLWLALKERYECSCSYPLFKDDTELQKACNKLCVGAAGRLWRTYYDSPKEEREKHRRDIRDISNHVKETSPVFGEKGWLFRFKIYSLLTRSTSSVSLGLAYLLNKVWLLLGRNRTKMYGEKAAFS